MKKSYRIFKGLWALAAIVSVVGLSGCKKEPPAPPSLPSLNILYGGSSATNLAIDYNIDGTIAVAGNDSFFQVEATRAWALTKSPADASWVTATPASGSEGTTKVTVSVTANDGRARSATLIIRTTDGTGLEKKVTINQAGESGGDIYYENFGTPTQTYGAGTYWPYMDQYPVNPAGSQNGFQKTGSGASTVTYTGSGSSVRTSGNSSKDYEGASGNGHAFFGGSGGGVMNINTIDITGLTNFTLTFGISEASSDTPPYYVPVTGAALTLEGSLDGTGWTALTFTNEATAGWILATSMFKAADGAEKLYLRFTGVHDDLRIDDVKLVEGGEGTIVIDKGTAPQPEGDPLTLAEVRALYTGTDYTFAEAKYTQGSVIVDLDQNNVASLKNLTISDGVSGITIRLVGDASPSDLPSGTEVYVNLKGLTLTAYQGLVQVGAPNANVLKTGQNKPITPTEITAAQFNEGAYQSMLVKVKDVQFVSAAMGKNLNDASFNIGTGTNPATNVPMESKTGDNMATYFSYYAKFKTSPVPDKSGYIIGVATVAGVPNVNQLMPRSTADFSGLDAGRFGGDVKYFNVTPEGPVTVSANGGVQTVNVAANVAWTAEVVAGNTATLSAGPTPLSGSANQAISLTFAKNEAAEGKTLTLRVTTTEDVTTKTYDVVFNQVAAGGGTGLIDRTAGLSAGTYYLAAIKTAGSQYELWTGAIATGNGVTNSYTYAGEVLTPVGADGAVVIELVAAGAANTYYIKYGTQYLKAIENKSSSLALSETEDAWVFSDAASGGINGTATVGAKLASATTASSNYIRSYQSTGSSFGTGVFFFPATQPAPAFGVSTASPVSVSADGGIQTVNVTGNVAWTAEVVPGNTATLSAQPTPASGTGAQAISLTIAQNVEQAAKSVTIRVSTTADVPTKTYDIVFDQAAASATPAFGVTTASPVAVSASGGAQTIAVTGNVAWTAEVVAGNTATFTGLTPGGTGAGNISLTIGANTELVAKSLTVRVSTTAAVTPNSYDIVFNQAAAVAGAKTATFDFAVIGAAKGWTSNTPLTGADAVFKEGDVTVTFGRGTHTSNDPAWNGGNIRMYALKNDTGGTNMVVATAVGTISSVQFTYGATKDATVRVDNGTCAAPYELWNLNAVSGTYSVYSTTASSQQRYISKIVVTYE